MILAFASSLGVHRTRIDMSVSLELWIWMTTEMFMIQQHYIVVWVYHRGFWDDDKDGIDEEDNFGIFGNDSTSIAKFLTVIVVSLRTTITNQF